MAEKIPYIPSSQVWSMQATAQQIDQRCGLGKGVNLLDNWYFGTGVISQRVQTSWGATGAYAYTVDRWKAISTAVELTSNGLVLKANASSSLTSQLTQVTETRKGLSGATLTFSALIDGRLHSVTKVTSTGNWFASTPFVGGVALTLAGTTGHFEARIKVSKENISHTVLACKLEIGTEQTLAVPDGEGGWILADPPPNPALELLKCQRYFYTLSPGPEVTGGYPGYAETSITTNTRTIVYLPVAMPSTPAIIGNPILICVPTEVKATVSSLTLGGDFDMVILKSTGVPGFTAGQNLFFIPSQTFALSCEP